MSDRARVKLWFLLLSDAYTLTPGTPPLQTFCVSCERFFDDHFEPIGAPAPTPVPTEIEPQFHTDPLTGQSPDAMVVDPPAAASAPSPSRWVALPLPPSRIVCVVRRGVALMEQSP